MFSQLLPSQRRYSDMTESWGGQAGSRTLDDPADGDAIPVGEARQLVIHFMSSFLSQGKMIPLNMMPVTMELELADADEAFTESNTNWEITRPRLIADVCQLDQALANSYAKHLLDGKSLPMYTHGLYSVKGAVASGTLFSFPIARGFTRLSRIYVTLWDGATAGAKWVNRFYSPLNGKYNDLKDDTLEWNVTIGADRYPSFNCESHQESFYRLRLTQLQHMGTDSFSISPQQYRTTKFIIGQSLEKAPGMASHTGINTRSGSQMTLNFKNLGSANMIHVILHYEQVVNVSAAGVEVLD
jgi:hypothetical protein